MSATWKEYEVALVTQEPFRIGALQDVMSGIDNPIATVGNRPVVQGSSLKGALRANVEQYLIEAYPNDPPMKPCIPSSRKMLSPEEKKLIERGIYRKGGSCLYSKRSKAGICPCCYLFGAQGLVGFVRVPYLFSTATPEELYSIRIDRATGVVAEGTNRDYQLLPDGVEFKGALEVMLEDKAKAWKLGEPRPLQTRGRFKGDKWLEAGRWQADRIIRELIVERLREIHLMGGFKSKGFGKVSITVTEA